MSAPARRARRVGVEQLAARVVVVVILRRERRHPLSAGAKRVRLPQPRRRVDQVEQVRAAAHDDAHLEEGVLSGLERQPVLGTSRDTSSSGSRVSEIVLAELAHRAGAPAVQLHPQLRELRLVQTERVIIAARHLPSAVWLIESQRSDATGPASAAAAAAAAASAAAAAAAAAALAASNTASVLVAAGGGAAGGGAGGGFGGGGGGLTHPTRRSPRHRLAIQSSSERTRSPAPTRVWRSDGSGATMVSS